MNKIKKTEKIQPNSTKVVKSDPDVTTVTLSDQLTEEMEHTRPGVESLGIATSNVVVETEQDNGTNVTKVWQGEIILPASTNGLSEELPVSTEGLPASTNQDSNLKVEEPPEKKQGEAQVNPRNRYLVQLTEEEKALILKHAVYRETMPGLIRRLAIERALTISSDSPLTARLAKLSSLGAGPDSSTE